MEQPGEVGGRDFTNPVNTDDGYGRGDVLFALGTVPDDDHFAERQVVGGQRHIQVRLITHGNFLTAIANETEYQNGSAIGYYNSEAAGSIGGSTLSGPFHDHTYSRQHGTFLIGYLTRYRYVGQ